MLHLYYFIFKEFQELWTNLNSFRDHLFSDGGSKEAVKEEKTEGTCRIY